MLFVGLAELIAAGAAVYFGARYLGTPPFFFPPSKGRQGSSLLTLPRIES